MVREHSAVEIPFTHPLPEETLSAKVRAQLGHQSRRSLRRLLSKQNFADIAEIMVSDLTPKEAIRCFQALPIELAAEVVTRLPEDLQHACLGMLLPAQIGRLLKQLPDDDAADILQSLKPDMRRSILGEMPMDVGTQALHQLLLEAPDTAAGLMTTDYVQINIEGTVADALAAVRQAEEKDFIYYCYLVDATETLVGVTSLKNLIVSQDDTPLKEIATFDAKSVLESYDQALVVNLFRKYDNLLAMPVVNQDDRLLGIITLDDVVYIIEEESTEDLYQATGIRVDTSDEKHLLSGPSFKAVQARMPWLAITVVGQLITAAIISQYTHTVSHAVVAFSYLPMLSGLAGNMGSQSDTIAVRGLALNLIVPGNFWQKLKRELRVALMVGGTFALSVGFISWLSYRRWELSLLLAISILTGVCVSALMGIGLPYAISRIWREDPAGMGAPFISTLMDIITYATYLSLVTLFIERMI
jgi:magnesium transporter